MRIAELSVEFLYECFTPDFEAGTLTWNKRPLHHFPDERTFKIWNTKYSSKRAGNIYKKGTNYEVWQIGVNDRAHLTHIVLWKMFHKKDPEGDISHMNGNQMDNTILNLKDQPHEINMRFQKKKVSNTSGITGVWWWEDRQRWIINTVRRKGSKIRPRISQTKCLLDAVAARLAHEKDMGLDPMHGK